jgi:hypothetical protein
VLRVATGCNKSSQDLVLPPPVAECMRGVSGGGAPPSGVYESDFATVSFRE